MNDFAILVNSCDKYSDLWPTFFYLLRKNWPESKVHNVYLNTETISEYKGDSTVKIINSDLEGKDLWGKRLIHCLSQISEEYVVVLMDDFFLQKALCNKKIEDYLVLLKNNSNIAVFYLIDRFKNRMLNTGFGGFFEIPKNSSYRLNSAPAIWRKSKLLEYTRENDNPWAWEYFGTCRTNHTNDLFYCVASDAIYDYAHAIYRGKWLEKAIQPLATEYNLNIDTSLRGLVKEGDTLPKRSLYWKICFVLTGLRMVGFDAVIELIRDLKNAYKKQ